MMKDKQHLGMLICYLPWERKWEELIYGGRCYCFQTVVLEKTLESPLDCKETKPANPKGNHPWMFIVRTDAEAQILWPPNAKSRLVGKDPDLGKDWRQQEKGAAEVEMIRWHHQLNGRESEQTPGNGERQRSLAFCGLRCCKQSDMT